MSTNSSSEMFATPTLPWRTIYRLTVTVCFVLLTIVGSTFTWWTSRTSGSTSISASQGASMDQQSSLSEKGAPPWSRFRDFFADSSYSSLTAKGVSDQTQTPKQSSSVARFTTWLRRRLSSVLRRPWKTNSSTSSQLTLSSQSQPAFGTQRNFPSPMLAEVLWASPMNLPSSSTD